LILLSFFLIERKISNITEASYLILIRIILKIGAAPLHNWSVPVAVACTPTNLILFLTLQKIFPFFIIKIYTNFLFFFFIFFIWRSLIWGATQNLSQLIIKNIIIISRISQLGWLLLRLLCTTIWEFYFIFYFFLLLIIFPLLKKNLLKLFSDSHNFKTIFIFLRLRGLPPFLGFFPKVLVIKISVIFSLLFTIALLLAFSLVDLYVYIRLGLLSILGKKIFLIWAKIIQWNFNLLFYVNLVIILFLVF